MILALRLILLGFATILSGMGVGLAGLVEATVDPTPFNNRDLEYGTAWVCSVVGLALVLVGAIMPRWSRREAGDR